ncbi:MarR family transcriptional regulator [Actinoplanes sp. CA-252034]|uniref:MarR family transcriptional regulator n=1 Tax=Actinoplanes sp. CA-252034 TaxID=3239906 RepID=UPI003D98125B
MEDLTGARFARLLLGAFDAMAAEVRAELTRAGHPGLTVANELAMQAIDAGADSASDLGRAIGVSRQAAAKTIASLEALGYVARAADAADGRRKQLAVTDLGREAVAVGAAAFDAIYERWKATQGAERVATVVKALDALALDALALDALALDALAR